MGRFTEILKNSAPTGSVLDVNIVNGSIDVVVNVSDFISVTPSGTFFTNVTPSGTFYTAGSVWQGTNPWIILGSVCTTNSIPTSKEYVNLVAGSPTATTGVFSQVVNHVSLSTMEGSMIVMLDGIAGLNSGLYFPAYSRDTYDCTCGSVSAYGVNGSLFALGTW